MGLLQQAVTSRQLRAISRTVVRNGGEKISQKVEGTTENLTVSVSGTLYQVFILGQGDPDEVNPDGTSRYYIP